MSTVTSLQLTVSDRGIYIVNVVEESWGTDYLDISPELYDSIIAALQSCRAEHVEHYKHKGITQTEPLPEWAEVYRNGGK